MLKVRIETYFSPKENVVKYNTIIVNNRGIETQHKEKAISAVEDALRKIDEGVSKGEGVIVFMKYKRIIFSSEEKEIVEEIDSCEFSSYDKYMVSEIDGDSYVIYRDDFKEIVMDYYNSPQTYEDFKRMKEEVKKRSITG